MAKKDSGKKQKRRRNSVIDPSHEFPLDENVDRKSKKKRKSKDISSSSEPDDENEPLPPPLLSRHSNRDVHHQSQKIVDRKSKKKRKSKDISSSSEPDDENEPLPPPLPSRHSNRDVHHQSQKIVERKSKKKNKSKGISSSSESDDENKILPPPHPPSDSDEDDHHQSRKMVSPKKLSKSTDLLQTFKTTNELSEVFTKPDKLQTELTESDVFFVQIPKNLHPQLLTDTQVSLVNEKTKLRLGEGTYIWDTSDPTLISLNVMGSHKKGKSTIKRVDCQKIIVREQFKLKQRPVDLEQVCEEAPFFEGENLKTRHPLFGLNYEDKIKLDEAVVEKLASKGREEKKKKKKKKKRDRKSSGGPKDEHNIFEEMFMLGGANELNLEVKAKKKKRS